MKKNYKKGFTLVELLATLAIMGIIVTIGVYSYKNYKEKSTEKLILIENEQIKIAAQAYLREIETNPNYKYYTNGSGETKSCISIKKLYEMGFYKGDMNFENKGYNDAVVKVTKINGVPSFEVDTKYDPDEDCLYYKTTSDELDDDDTKIILGNEDDDNPVNLTANISQNRNFYYLNLDFSSVFHMKEINKALYVLFVLDRTGSMSVNNAYTTASNSISTISENVISISENSYVALSTFVDYFTLDREFKHEKITEFPPMRGDTSFYLAWQKTEEIIKTITDNDAIKYVVFLTDGNEPCSPNVHSPGTSINNQYKNNCDVFTNNIKQNLNTNIIVVSYKTNYNGNLNLLPEYKRFASTDPSDTICPTSTYYEDGTKYCYYPSNMSDISKIFDGVLDSIKTNVSTQRVSKVDIKLEINDNLNLYNISNAKIQTIEETLEIKSQNVAQVFTYKIDANEINEDLFTCQYDDQICTYTGKLFDSYSMNLYDLDGNITKTINVDASNIPDITINKVLDSYIN